MKSPFPGMDPYLEQYWQDVHASLMIYARDQLEEQLPGNMIARVEERIVFEIEGARERWVYPDVKILEREGRGFPGGAVATPIAVADPVIVEYQGEPTTETYINILEAGPGQRLVTVIEILSLTNKLAGEGQRRYRQKQVELCDAGVSLVEIDLLRRGERVTSVPPKLLPKRVRTTYQVCVRRGWTPWRWEIYPVPLQSRLPGIRIPLRQKDEDIRLDLQAIVDLAYRKGRYGATIAYDAPPEAPLTRQDGKWIRTVLKKARKG
jgi:hypothetical protein